MGVCKMTDLAGFIAPCRVCGGFNGVRKCKSQAARSLAMNFLGFLEAPLHFLQQALLAAKSEAQRPKTRTGGNRSFR